MAAGPRPEYPTSAQAWRLLQMGNAIEPLVETWEAVRDVPWSTLGIEQLHAGTAVFKNVL